MQFKPGDRVYYIGSHRTVQQDYGKQELIIFAIDPKTRRVACTTPEGHWLIGVNSEDVQYAKEYVLQGAQAAK